MQILIVITQALAKTWAASVVPPHLSGNHPKVPKPSLYGRALGTFLVFPPVISPLRSYEATRLTRADQLPARH